MQTFLSNQKMLNFLTRKHAFRLLVRTESHVHQVIADLVIVLAFAFFKTVFRLISSDIDPER